MRAPSTRADALATAKNFFHTSYGSALYEAFQSEYLATPRKVFLEVALHKLNRPPRRVLDVGCGSGDALAYLGARLPDAELVGIDPEAAMLARARGIVGARCRIFEASLMNIPAEARPEPFDLIVSYSNFRFWNEPAAGLARTRELLAPRGLAYLLDLRRDIDDDVRAELVGRMPGDELRTFLSSQLDSAYGVDEVRAIMFEAGIDEAALHVGGFAGYPPKSREAFALLQKNERLAEIIFGMHKTGFQSDRGHESVFHITIAK